MARRRAKVRSRPCRSKARPTVRPRWSIGSSWLPSRRHSIPRLRAKKFPSQHTLLIVGEVPEVSAAMEIVLAAEGYRVRQLVAGKTARAASDTIVEADFSSAQSLQAMPTACCMGATSECFRSGARSSICSRWKPVPPAARNHRPTNCKPALRLATATFNIVKHFADDLVRSTADGGGWLINFTSLNGKFGVDATGAYPLAQAGTLGVMKAAAKELSGVRVKNIDLDPSVDQQSLFTGVVTAEIDCRRSGD